MDNKTPLDSPALQRQGDGYPEAWAGKVPLRVRMRQMVTADAPMRDLLPECRGVVCGIDCEYPVWVNSYGAVCAILSDGRMLGLKPGEFEVVAFHETSVYARLGVLVLQLPFGYYLGHDTCFWYVFNQYDKRVSIADTPEEALRITLNKKTEGNHGP